MNLRSLEAKWDKEKKTPKQKARLRWWYKNKGKIEEERKSLNLRSIIGKA